MFTGVLHIGPTINASLRELPAIEHTVIIICCLSKVVSRIGASHVFEQTACVVFSISEVSCFGLWNIKTLSKEACFQVAQQLMVPPALQFPVPY
jgi:hypothetical protein